MEYLAANAAILSERHESHWLTVQLRGDGELRL